MGFGGAVSAMITSLKNNKRERKNIFESDITAGWKSQRKFVDHKKSTPQQLRALRERISAERRARSIKVYGITGFILAVLLSVLILFL